MLLTNVNWNCTADGKRTRRIFRRFSSRLQSIVSRFLFLSILPETHEIPVAIKGSVLSSILHASSKAAYNIHQFLNKRLETRTTDSIGHNSYLFLGGLKEGFDGRFYVVIVLFQQSYADALVRLGDRLHLHYNGLFEFISTVSLDCGQVIVSRFFGSQYSSFESEIIGRRNHCVFYRI
jgi:hypothetical protein